jgi:hypothetical protein
MLAWNVEPCPFNWPATQAGAAGAEADAALDDPAPADALDEGAGVLLVDVAALLLLVPHAAAAKSPPTVSSVAAMREVLTG